MDELIKEVGRICDSTRTCFASNDENKAKETEFDKN